MLFRRQGRANSGSFKAGFQEIVLHEWDAASYGYHDGGKLVMEVDPGFLSEKTGLQAGDLIVAVDGVLFKDDRYIIEKGKARMAEGSIITVTVERPGQEGMLDLVFSR